MLLLLKRLSLLTRYRLLILNAYQTLLFSPLPNPLHARSGVSTITAQSQSFSGSRLFTSAYHIYLLIISTRCDSYKVCYNSLRLCILNVFILNNQDQQNGDLSGRTVIVGTGLAPVRKRVRVCTCRSD